jgi:hypothetical protein
MPLIYVKAPDTPEQTAYKIKLAEQSKAALETCLENMRKSLIANVNTWNYAKIEEHTREIKQTQCAIASTIKKIENLKSKLS